MSDFLLFSRSTKQKEQKENTTKPSKARNQLPSDFEIKEAQPATVDKSTISKDALVASFKEIQAVIVNLKGSLCQMQNRVSNHDLTTKNGLSFLEIKHQIIMDYCMNLLMLFLVKFEGQSITNSPVVDNLIELRVTLEKISPIDSKLKYQVDKLLKMALGSSYETQGDMEFLKARPDQFVTDEAAENEDGQSIYRAPKLAAAIMQREKDISRAERAVEQAKKRASRSTLLREMREELSEAPEIDSSSGVGLQVSGTLADRLAKEDKERTKYEEDNFARIQLSKSDRKRRKLAAREQMGALNNLQTLGDMSVLNDIEVVQKRAKASRRSGDQENDEDDFVSKAKRAKPSSQKRQKRKRK